MVPRVEGEIVERKEVKPAIKFKPKEKTFATKLKEAVFGEHVDNIPEHLILKVFVPAIKQTCYDMFCLGLGAAFGIDYDRRKKRGSSNSGYTGYFGSSSSSRDSDDDVDDYRPDSYRDIWFDSREDAIEVYNTMLDYVADDTYVSVLTFYGIADRRSPHASRDDRIGWYKEDLRNPEIFKRSGKWYIDLPRPTHLDRR